MALYDISPTVSERLAVWPGDTPLSREVLCDMRRGDNITLSTLRATVHLGAHADAPNHYAREGGAIEGRDLARYLGRCEVVHVAAARNERVGRKYFSRAPAAERVLIATGTYPDPEAFNRDFAALDPTLIDWLHEQGVVLVGLDAPSVDLCESKDLPSHGRLMAHDMAVLEGLVLAHVPAGVYELIALPLKLEGFDASPVRAVLRTITPQGL